MAVSSRRSSISPSGRLYSGGGGGGGSFSSAFASYSSSLASRSSIFFGRPSSPTRVNLGSPAPHSTSVRFSIENCRPTSPGDGPVVKRSIAAARRRTCMCSPTTHPGSFRCSLHKGLRPRAAAPPSNRLHARRSAMTNSLVRIGAVEGDWVKRALAALIRPSSHQQRRRAAFHPRPSRLSVVSMANDP